MRKINCLLFAAISIFAISRDDAKAAKHHESNSFTRANVFQDRNSISGFVFDESRVPVARVNVELLNDTYSTVARMQTRGSGTFSFSGLPAGQYNVKVVTSGTDYEEQTRSVSLVPFSIIQGRGVATEQIDFYLKIRRRTNVPTGAPGVVFVQDVPDRAKTLYESGLTDLSAKNEKEAFENLKKSIEIFPDYFLALDRLGTEYVMRGYYDAAAVLLTKALSVNPRSFSSTFALGLAEFRRGQTDKALDYFNGAVRIDKASANPHLWLGIAFHAKNDLPKALSAMLRANDLSDGTSAEVHWQLARVYKDQKRFSEAADELELFLKYKPDAKNFHEIKQIIVTLRQKK